MSALKVVSNLPRRMREAEIPLLSASLAFATLLSLVPFLAVGFVVFQKLTGFETIGAQVQAYILTFFKATAGADATQVVRKVLSRLAQRSWTTTNVVVLFFTSFKIFLDLERSVNRIWAAKRAPPLWWRMTKILGFYLLVPFGLAAYIGLRSANFLQPIFSSNPKLWDAGLAFVLLYVVNKWMPSPKVSSVVAAIGAAVSAAGLLILSKSFAWMTKEVFQYSKLYGALAALPLLCLWILMTWQIVLVGVAAASGLQNPAGDRA